MCVIALLVIVTRHGSVFHTTACATNVHSPPCLVFWSSPHILTSFPATLVRVKVEQEHGALALGDPTTSPPMRATAQERCDEEIVPGLDPSAKGSHQVLEFDSKPIAPALTSRSLGSHAPYF